MIVIKMTRESITRMLEESGKFDAEGVKVICNHLMESNGCSNPDDDSCETYMPSEITGMFFQYDSIADLCKDYIGSIGHVMSDLAESGDCALSAAPQLLADGKNLNDFLAAVRMVDECEHRTLLEHVEAVKPEHQSVEEYVSQETCPAMEFVDLSSFEEACTAYMDYNKLIGSNIEDQVSFILECRTPLGGDTLLSVPARVVQLD